MTVEQISIFVENKTGGLREVTNVLYQNGIDLRALSIAETPDFGVLRAIVNDTQKAADVLKEAGCIYSVTPVLAVAIEDAPGGLYKVLDVLGQNDINVNYTYAFAGRDKDTAYMIFRVEDNEKAEDVLAKNGLPLVSQEKLYQL